MMCHYPKQTSGNSPPADHRKRSAKFADLSMNASERCRSLPCRTRSLSAERQHMQVTNHHCAVRKVVGLSMLCRLFVATCPTRRIGPSVALSNCLLGGEIKRGAGEISLGWETCKLHCRSCPQPHFQEHIRSALLVRSRVPRGTSLSTMRIARTEALKTQPRRKTKRSDPAYLRFLC